MKISEKKKKTQSTISSLKVTICEPSDDVVLCLFFM